MGAWARDQKTGGKVRMLADGSADFAKATGLTLDLTARGMGLRSNRYSMLVKDGVVADAQRRGARASSRSATPTRCWRRPSRSCAERLTLPAPLPGVGPSQPIGSP